MSDFIALLTAINPLKDLFVPALSAIAGLWLATRKFKHERLWQEKYAAYQTAIASVEAIRYWGDEVSTDALMLPSIGWFDGKTAQDFYAEAKREVAKQSAIGAMLLAPDFVARLSEFQTTLFIKTCEITKEFQSNGRKESLHGVLAEEVRYLTEKFLPSLIELARKDLGA